VCEEKCLSRCSSSLFVVLSLTDWIECLRRAENFVGVLYSVLTVLDFLFLFRLFCLLVELVSSNGNSFLAYLVLEDGFNTRGKG